jgi:hypothetical protein
VAKINEEIRRELLKRAAEGEGSESLAGWLRSAHGITITGRAVRKRIAEVQRERADVAKVIVRETLTREIPDDLARLERIAADAYKMAQGHKKDPKLWCLLMEQVRKVSETKLHFSGADVPDDSLTTLQAAADRLRHRLTREED